MSTIAPVNQSEQSYYALLGVEPHANAEEIKSAYHKLAFQFHPDRNCTNAEAHKKMEKINEAYAVLSDPVRRRDYDLSLGYTCKVPKFKQGTKVKIGANSPSQYRGCTGVVDKEPIKDAFRFWYMVRIESNGLTAVRRFAEEELE
ncbi:MAG: J domain-containing protein [Dehalococcoidia bacterium]